MFISADGRFTTLTGRCAVQGPDIQPRSTRGVRLLNHIVHAQEQRLQDREAQRLGGLQVDDEVAA
jgi:hypothetical protein